MDLAAQRAEWRESGVMVLPKMLDAEALRRARQAFDTTEANPARMSRWAAAGGSFSNV